MGSARAVILAVINLSCDSFSDASRCNSDPDRALTRITKAFEAGADYADVGAVSYHPRNSQVTTIKEWCRLEPFLTRVSAEMPEWREKIFINTAHARIAEQAIELGFRRFNIHGGIQTPWVPLLDRIEQVVSYPSSPCETAAFFRAQFALCDDAQYPKTRLWCDPAPGISSKTYKEALTEIINYRETAKEVGESLLVASSSRKRHIAQLAKKENVQLIPHSATTNASVALACYLYHAGARIFRVHDVQETREALTVWERLFKHSQGECLDAHN